MSAVAPLRRLPARGRFSEILRETEELPDAPYRGISSYRLLDSGLLFARDDQIERLVQLILVYRAALVFGESGVGKTSMLNAGFVPEALRLGYLPERVRLRYDGAAPLVIEHIGLETSSSGATLPSNFGIDRTGARSSALGLEDFPRPALGPGVRRTAPSSCSTSSRSWSPSPRTRRRPSSCKTRSPCRASSSNSSWRLSHPERWAKSLLTRQTTGQKARC